MSRDGALLHRSVYRAYYGDIPKGCDVHHKDEDKTNWSPDNLEALPRSDHVKRHRPRGWNASSKEKRQENAWKQWAETKARDVVCVGCGIVFKSTGVRAKYCHANCRQRHYLRTGRIVKQRKARPKKGRKVRPPKPCVVCGKPFKARDPRTCAVLARMRGSLSSPA